uniref:Uncharacterized protein n=1 Tax=Moniliophthora roreri TaxID=221103 RepID=A0A0W0F982_MONRR
MDPAGEDVTMTSSDADYDDYEDYLSKQLWTRASGAEVVLGTHELEARNTPRRPDKKPEKTGNLGVVSQRRDNNETVVPLEIILLIIDHLHDDHTTLKTLIKACPMLEAHCRPHIYRRASFHAFQETDFSALCPYPLVVRHLELISSRCPEPTWMGSLLSRIDELSAVESLGCCDFHWEDFSDPGTACYTLLSSPVTRHIKDLFLCGFYADEFYDIALIISAFPSLERLTISMDDVDEGSPILDSTHLPPPPTGLREMVVHEGGGCNQMGNFWSWFYVKHFIGLRTIELAPSFLGDYPLFEIYMGLAGDALTHLSVALQSREHIFAFANTQILLHAKNLEILEVSQYCPDPWNIPILGGILGRASCPRLAKLILPKNAVPQGYDPLTLEEFMLAKPQNLPAGEDRQPNEGINKRAEDAPPSIISVAKRGGGRGRGIGRGFGSNLHGNGREASGAPRNAVNSGIPARGFQRGRDGSAGRGRGRGNTRGGHPAINTGVNIGHQQNIHASVSTRAEDGSISSVGWPKGRLNRDQGWAGMRARSQREDIASQANATSSSCLDSLNESRSVVSNLGQHVRPQRTKASLVDGPKEDPRQQEDSVSNMRKAAGLAEAASHPNPGGGGGRAPSPHRMPPPHRNLHEPYTHAPTNPRLHFHPQKRQKAQDEELTNLLVERSSSPSESLSDYDLQYPDTDDSPAALSSPQLDHINLRPGSASALILPQQAPLLHDNELHGKSPSTVYKDVGVQWIDPSSSEFHHATEQSQPSLIRRVAPALATPTDTENVGVQWQGSVNIVISLKRPINSTLVSGTEGQTQHEPTELRSPKRQKLASEGSMNASVSAPDTQHPMTAGVKVKVERRSPSVELTVSPTSGNPPVKIERRSPSPASLESVRNRVTEGSQWYHPMPARCHKSNPNWMLNRRKWFDKESAVLMKKGLKLGRHFFRDDGMVIDWTSSIPRWPDTLDPSSPSISLTNDARKPSQPNAHTSPASTIRGETEVIDLIIDVDESPRPHAHISSAITIRSETEVIDFVTDVDESPRPNTSPKPHTLNPSVNQESSIATKHASSLTTTTSPYSFSVSLHSSKPIPSPSRSDTEPAKRHRPSSSAHLSLQKPLPKTSVSKKRRPLPILPVMTPPLNSTIPAVPSTRASSSSVGLSHPKPPAVLPLLPVMTPPSRAARSAHSTKTPPFTLAHADSLAVVSNEADSRNKDVPLSKGMVTKPVTASSSFAVGAATAPNENDSSDEDVPLSKQLPNDLASTSARNQKLDSRPHQTTPRTPLPGWTVLASPPPSPPSSSRRRSPPPDPPRLPQKEQKKGWAPPIRSLFPPRSMPSDDKDEDELDDDSEKEMDFTFEHICAPARRRRQRDQSMKTQADVDPNTDPSEDDMGEVEEDLLGEYSDVLIENRPWVDNKSEEAEVLSINTAPETIWMLSDSEGE